MSATTVDVHADDDIAQHHTSTGLSNEKLAMWVFLGSECLLFGGLISTFLLYRERTPKAGPTIASLYDIPYTPCR